MATIDKAALIEAAAKAVRAEECERLQSKNLPPLLAWHEMLPAARINRKYSIETALPVIAAGLLAPLRELHVPVETREWLPNAVAIPWNACSCGFRTYSACPTVRLLDQIEADAKGGER